MEDEEPIELTDDLFRQTLNRLTVVLDDRDALDRELAGWTLTQLQESKDVLIRAARIVRSHIDLILLMERRR